MGNDEVPHDRPLRRGARRRREARIRSRLVGQEASHADDGTRPHREWYRRTTPSAYSSEPVGLKPETTRWSATLTGTSGGTMSVQQDAHVEGSLVTSRSPESEPVGAACASCAPVTARPERVGAVSERRRSSLGCSARLNHAGLDGFPKLRVVGSSPIARSYKAPGNEGFSLSESNSAGRRSTLCARTRASWHATRRRKGLLHRFEHGDSDAAQPQLQDPYERQLQLRANLRGVRLLEAG